ncbi:MAG: Na/Pi cotransporter family protein [Lachnospiraceae bacterium]|nr:Na/Pi cotransporter family protein [Lachnospiraceae bacterium]
MDIFNVLTMLGGLALFLYGMNALGDGLAKLSGGKLERILEKMTNSKLKAVALGAAVTAVIQSSSATTVMVVGFVNSGIMKLSQAVGVIMGANIGTTITSWILSLSGIESSNFIVKLFKPTSFSPIFALIGVALLMFSKKDKRKDIGTILIGFAILMFGMDTMSSAVKPLAEVKAFTNILTMFSNPILGMLAGLVLTAVIQSSSASVGILQALCGTGLGYSSAIPIIMGQNIGTCVTAMISSIGANKNARRAALIHLYFNIIGTAIFMGGFYLIHAIVGFPFMGKEANELGIAIVHTTFNVVATTILLPFSNGLVKLACLTVRDEEVSEEVQGEDGIMPLDSRFLDKPGFAIEQCKHVSVEMARISKESIMMAVSLLSDYNEDVRQKVVEYEAIVDKYEDELGTYMVKLSSRNMSEEDSKTLSMLLHCIGDFERISDHALNLCETAVEMHEKQISFSKAAEKEILVYTNALKNIVNLTCDVFSRDDVKEAVDVEPLEEVIDLLTKKLKKRHIERLRNGDCTIELGFIFADITGNCERVADHCSNIAVALIQIHDDGFDTHEYLDNVRREDNKAFMSKFEEYKELYKLEKLQIESK